MCSCDCLNNNDKDIILERNSVLKQQDDEKNKVVISEEDVRKKKCLSAICFLNLFSNFSKSIEDFFNLLLHPSGFETIVLLLSKSKNLSPNIRTSFETYCKKFDNICDKYNFLAKNVYNNNIHDKGWLHLTCNDFLSFIGDIRELITIIAKCLEEVSGQYKLNKQNIKNWHLNDFSLLTYKDIWKKKFPDDKIIIDDQIIDYFAFFSVILLYILAASLINDDKKNNEGWFETSSKELSKQLHILATSVMEGLGNEGLLKTSFKELSERNLLFVGLEQTIKQNCIFFSKNFDITTTIEDGLKKLEEFLSLDENADILLDVLQKKGISQDKKVFFFLLKNNKKLLKKVIDGTHHLITAKKYDGLEYSLLTDESLQQKINQKQDFLQGFVSKKEDEPLKVYCFFNGYLPYNWLLSAGNILEDTYDMLEENIKQNDISIIANNFAGTFPFNVAKNKSEETVKIFDTMIKNNKDKKIELKFSTVSMGNTSMIYTLENLKDKLKDKINNVSIKEIVIGDVPIGFIKVTENPEEIAKRLINILKDFNTNNEGKKEKVQITLCLPDDDFLHKVKYSKQFIRKFYGDVLRLIEEENADWIDIGIMGYGGGINNIIKDCKKCNYNDDFINNTKKPEIVAKEQIEQGVDKMNKEINEKKEKKRKSVKLAKFCLNTIKNNEYTENILLLNDILKELTWCKDTIDDGGMAFLKKTVLKKNKPIKRMNEYEIHIKLNLIIKSLYQLIGEKSFENFKKSTTKDTRKSNLKYLIENPELFFKLEEEAKRRRLISMAERELTKNDICKKDFSIDDKISFIKELVLFEKAILCNRMYIKNILKKKNKQTIKIVDKEEKTQRMVENILQNKLKYIEEEIEKIKTNFTRIKEEITTKEGILKENVLSLQTKIKQNESELFEFEHIRAVGFYDEQLKDCKSVYDKTKYLLDTCKEVEEEFSKKSQ